MSAAVIERIEALVEELDQWCQTRCRACYDVEFGKVHSHDCGITRRLVVAHLRAALTGLAPPDPAQEGDAAGDGCDCTELCSMGPTCPGGILARLPGAGCWRTR